MPTYDERTTIIDQFDELATQPSIINIPLKNHQLAILYQARLLETGRCTFEGNMLNTNIGILCDKPGAGKSYVALGLMENNIDRQVDIVYSSGEFYITKKHEPSETNLLVVPNGIFNQWIQYVRNTELTVNICDSTNYVDQNKMLNIVSAKQYRNMYQVLNKQNQMVPITDIKFNRVIFDEVDSINIPNCPKYDSSFYWFISASIAEMYDNKIRNNGFLKDMFRKLQSVNTTYKKYIYIRCDPEFVNMSMAVPEMIVHNIKIKSGQLNVLSGIIDDRARALVQANNIQEFAQLYNVQLSSSYNIIDIVCESLIKDKQNLTIDLEAAQRRTYSSERTKTESIQRIQEQITEIDRKISLIKERISETNLCPISYEEIVNPAVVKCCKQTFELSSIQDYMASTRNPKCPFCKVPLSASQIVVVNDEIRDTEEETKEEEPNDGWISTDHTREENIIHTITNKCGNNIIIFSHYESAFENIKDLGSNIEVKQLKGRHKQEITIKWINTRRSNKKKILLLNSRDFGAGVNIEQATDVIIWHQMRSDVENQCICRAQRYGRPDQLNVWKFEE
jgi:Helicase conserved C-terminal domain/SNF2-related domain